MVSAGDSAAMVLVSLAFSTMASATLVDSVTLVVCSAMVAPY